jgi:hypothetical protein
MRWTLGATAQREEEDGFIRSKNSERGGGEGGPLPCNNLNLRTYYKRDTARAINSAHNGDTSAGASLNTA